MGTMTQHLYYQTSGSRTTPSGVISPMSPEWNLNTAAQRPVETAKGLNVQGPVPAVFVEVCCLVGSMEKKHDAKTHIIKTKKIHKNTQHLINMLINIWNTHQKKRCKTKAIFSSALIAKLLSALAACNSQNRWNYLTAGSFTKYYPQHSPKLFIAPFPSSCCKQALFNHFFLCYLSVFFLCLAASSNFQFWCRLSSKFLPGRSRRSHLNAPTKLPRSFISYRDFAESHSDELSINSTF